MREKLMHIQGFGRLVNFFVLVLYIPFNNFNHDWTFSCLPGLSTKQKIYYVLLKDNIPIQ